MRISKTLVLSLLLIAVLAITVTSQSPQNSVSAEEIKTCSTVFYYENQDNYDYVTRTRSTYGNCIYYQNYTSCMNNSGPNTDCSINTNSYNYNCIIGSEQYQSYEKIGTESVLKNRSECSTSKFLVSITKDSITEKKEIDFSSWGVCVNSTENGCLAIVCGTQKGGSAVNGVFNGCDGGKSCQKFLFCKDSTQVLYKASRNDFVWEDPTYRLSQLALKEVGQ